MAHLRALKHTSVSGRLMDKGALLRPCKQTKPHPLPQARLVISAMAADGSRPGGRARSPSPQGSPLENAAAPPQSPDVERPSNGAGGRMSSSASIEEPPSIPNSVLERPSGGSSRVSMSDGSNGIPGGNGSVTGGPGGNSNGGGGGGPMQGGSSGGGGDFLKPLLTWGVLYAFLASVAWLGSK
eukprot:CAMPEP_0202357634 /NCGR_PEP_ID=MMETSP1126-20121109/11584_1 /ASSEMBLY_ACC=CAM_ASM_000457 /TAXON_ID=3047 /ORGANISM="Dunaliella tertiolecta, Strain CCMP1320" /LENGTH=182 /DNA_ID=CAMNT_0048950557 /DNA_START=74 /DNA_END=622 /DNA_ORIENTATION=-